MRSINRRPAIGTILWVYLLCVGFRGIEYMILRTDQTIIGEAFIHKLAGIAVLFAALGYCALRPRDIGFCQGRILENLMYGLVLGAGVYAAAYGIEYLVLRLNHSAPSLKLYVTGYSVDGNLGNRTELLFFAICIIGNIINVVMEEGIFRGLFLKLAERRYSFYMAVACSSVLFGLWHIAAPLRSFLDGERSLPGTLMMMAMLVITTGLGGVKFCLMTKITGSLWFPMADHFFNNTIINILHISTAAGADVMQTVRISAAQTVSFLLVLVFFLRGNYYRRKTFR